MLTTPRPVPSADPPAVCGSWFEDVRSWDDQPPERAPGEADDAAAVPPSRLTCTRLAGAAPAATGSARSRLGRSIARARGPAAEDGAGRPRGAIRLPLLRRRLRPARLREGRGGVPDRGRPRQPD